MMPLYGFLEGDTMGLLVLADERGTAAELARNLQRAAACRVRPFDDARVVFNGRVLDPEVTLAAAGLTALDRFDVVGAGGAR